MSLLCIAAGGVVASLLAQSFTLSWTHSIEKTEWQEDWRIEDGGLRLTAARIRGSGAGMEVPDGAVLAGGWYHYWPDLPPQPRLLLARSGAPGTGDYTICRDGGCASLQGLLPARAAAAESVELAPCPIIR